MMPEPSATPAPIHETAELLPVFPYPLWMVLLAGAVALAVLVLLGWLLWRLIFKKGPGRELTPRERARAELALLKSREFETYEFGVQISDVLRTYLEEQFGLKARTATSLEFLGQIRNHQGFTEEEKESLKQFLETVDLIKFARQDAAKSELERLFASAEGVVNKAAEVVG